MVEDLFGRRFHYLRLSLTDICNFRCQYCLPDGYKKQPSANFLSPDEICRLVKGFAELGLWKLRFTGGEPATRPDLLEIIQKVAKIEGIRKIAMTTNGYNLKQHAYAYKEAGITALNVSIDSLNPGEFYRITGKAMLDHVLAGVEKAQEAGFEQIKINAVLLKNHHDDFLEPYLAWLKHEDISVRFIELMQTGSNETYFRNEHLPASHIEQRLTADGWHPIARDKGAGPAQEFMHPDYKGKLGLIAPYSKDFCKGCNRLRVSSSGKLHLCLFGETHYNLRPWLQADEQKEGLKDAILTAMNFKHETHQLHQMKTGITPHLASIGG